MSEVGVVHLVRAKNGITPFKAFLDSYRKYPGGLDHDLILLFKGFRSKKEIEEHRILLKDVPHQSLYLLDYGFDIRGYFVAVSRFNYAYLCFLNSFSILRDVTWLAKLHNCLLQPGVGITGATGSCESSYTNNFSEISANSSKLARLRREIWLKKLARQFDPFPNYHVRTNGFMVSNNVLSKVRRSFLLSKMDAHQFESGKHGLTKQIVAMGLSARITGCDGKCYAPEEWGASNTFRIGNQGNLLIADNQTEAYKKARPEYKSLLSAYAWGRQSTG